MNLDVVWDTVQSALPALLQLLPAVRLDAQKQVQDSVGAAARSPMVTRD